jgi:hypothetical protein
MQGFGFRRASALGPCLALALLLVSGCGQEELPKTYAVTGKVVLKNGKPLSGGFITFRSVANHEHRAYGNIAADGTFTLDTIALTSKARSARLAGAVEAEFHVTIRPSGSVDDGTGGPPVGGGRPAFTLKKTYKIEAKENNDLTVVVE